MKPLLPIINGIELIVTGLLTFAVVANVTSGPTNSTSKAVAYGHANRTVVRMIAISEKDDFLYFDRTTKSFKSKSSTDKDGGKGTSITEINGVVFKSLLSPDRKKIAIESSMGEYGEENEVWILDLTSKSNPTRTRLVPTGSGRLMEWHPGSNHVLYVPDRNGLADWGLWLVDIKDGSHVRIDVPEIAAPEMIVSAVYRPSSGDLAVGISRGIGFGSSVFLKGQQGDSRLIWHGDQAIASDLSWSYDGQSLAFLNLEDSATPFTAAELMVYDSASGQLRSLALADGGHGQKPVWLPDNKSILFVHRSNLDSEDADYESDKLLSDIRKVNIADGTFETVVESNNSRNLDISVNPSGYVAFASITKDASSSIVYIDHDRVLKPLVQMNGVIRFPMFLVN